MKLSGSGAALFVQVRPLILISRAMTTDQLKQQRFLAAFEPVRRRFSAYVQAMVRNNEEARDIVSETILIAYEQFEDVRTPASFVFYLFTIARRIYMKRERRGRLFGRYDPEEVQHIPSQHDRPDVSADVRLLYEALARLPARQREAVVLFDIADCTLEEVKAIQGGTLSGVKSRLKRGREHLAELLGVRNDLFPSVPMRASADERSTMAVL